MCPLAPLGAYAPPGGLYIVIGRGVRLVERKFPKLKAGGSSPFSLVAVVLASLGVTKDGKNIRSFFLFANTYKLSTIMYVWV